MKNRKVIHAKPSSNSDDFDDFVTSALSGTTGGALLGSSFGLAGGIIGSLIGGFFTGYSGYRMIYKKQLPLKGNIPDKRNNH